MKFALRNAPKWFSDHIFAHYLDKLQALQREAKRAGFYSDQDFKQITLKYFQNRGFTVWQDEETGYLWFDVDENSAFWAFEILRN